VGGVSDADGIGAFCENFPKLNARVIPIGVGDASHSRKRIGGRRKRCWRELADADRKCRKQLATGARFCH